jgi:hypothetical protein
LGKQYRRKETQGDKNMEGIKERKEDIILPIISDGSCT